MENHYSLAYKGTSVSWQKCWNATAIYAARSCWLRKNAAHRIWEARAFLPFKSVRTVTTIPYIIRTSRKLTADRSTSQKSA